MFWKRRKKTRAEKEKQKEAEAEESPAFSTTEDHWTSIEKDIEDIRQEDVLKKHNQAVLRKKKVESERHFRQRARQEG